ncbi:GumC family protein [Desertivirga brevis]|uniref:GumC family protein n=1 Tax=Desertivirga brevis TaxID=2810310 RepID=UPI001A9590E6|nr:tyrosine-protein kinase [Pedobacter sp. SYSU D00873]
MNTPDNSEKKILEQKIDYSKIFRIIWSRWYWILSCVIIALIIAYSYLWYTPAVYSTNGSLKFDEKRTELNDLLSSNSNMYSRNNKLQSEGFVIQSRDVLLNAIGRLDYKVTYLLKGKVRTTDVYPNKPFPIEILEQDSTDFINKLIDITPLNQSTFSLKYKDGKNDVVKNYTYGQVVKLQGVTFKVKGNYSSSDDANYAFRFNTKADFLGRASNILTKEAAKSANVMQLTLSDKNPVFAMDLLNSIMKEYVDYDVKLRGTSASQTIDFIERQLSFLYNKVQQSGGALEKYKKANRMIDLSSSTELSMQRYSNQQSQKQALKLEELAIDQLQKQIENNRDRVSLNFNLEGAVGGLLSGLLSQLNSLIIEREKKLVQFNESSAPVQQLDKQISEIKQGIINNIRLLRERNQKTQSYVENQIASAQQELNNIPSAERDFAKLQSEFDINQKVFSYLSEKRLEAQITRAAVVPGATIVDFATSYSIISPIPSKIYTNSILLGFLSGVALIFLARVLNPYIYDKDTVMSYTNTPIIGVIRKFPGFIDENNTQALSLQQPKSAFAESVRSVRTNLSFLASEKNSKIICVTSEVAGEGKSFVSVNLASTLALIDKKVILVGADLRRSKLHRTFNIENKKGLSSFLSRQADLDSIISKTSLETLDFIPSGPVPPNPSELLHSSMMKELLSELDKRYDYVLIDTAPVGLVSDSIPLIRNSDINIFVIRSGTSKYNSATIPDKLSNEYHLNNVVIVLNAFGDDMLHGNYYQTTYYGNYTQYYYSEYSNSYSSGGYYMDDKKARWWEIWKKS